MEPPERRENSSSRFECFEQPGAQELDQSHASPSGRKLMRNSSQDPTAYSQERQQDDTQSSSTRKLERGDDIQIGRRMSEFQIMQVSDCRSLEKVFKNLRQKLNLAEEAPVIGIEGMKTNVLIG